MPTWLAALFKFDLLQGFFWSGMGLLFSTIVGGICFLIGRAVTGAAKTEKIGLYNEVAALVQKARDAGASPDEIAALRRTFLPANTKKVGPLDWAFRRKPDVENENTVSELLNLPMQYWSNWGMKKRAGSDLDVADSIMHQALTEIETLLNDDEFKRFQGAQAAWENFRDKQVEYVEGQFEGGTMAGLIAVAEAKTLTDARTTDILAHMRELKER